MALQISDHIGVSNLSTVSNIRESLLPRSLEGSAFVVLDGSGSVGSALCEQLLDQGATVSAIVRRESTVPVSLQNRLSNVAFADASVPERLEAEISSAIERLGRIDGLANCIGTLYPRRGEVTSIQEFEETLRVNVSASSATLRACLQPMRKSGGSIVFCTSTTADFDLSPNHEFVAAAKSAVTNLAMAAAASNARFGIRINTVSPGPTKMKPPGSAGRDIATLPPADSGHLTDQVIKAAARMVSFLLHPDSSFITGANLNINGDPYSLMKPSGPI